MTNATAILIFAQPVARDAVQKRVAHQALSNRQALQRLTERTRLVARATNLPVIESAALIDHKGSFGEQLDKACRATFSLGYEQILVVANDCPALTTDHLMKAANRVAQTPVLGPDQRGGLYLIGMTRQVFESISFLTLPWQTTKLAQAVRQWLSQRPATLLARLGDVNSHADLQRYQSGTLAVALFINRLLRLITNALNSPNGFAPLVRLKGSYAGADSLRPPPVEAPRS
ncbi:DUF2064 domain-containing protein [Fibrella aquatica]|uniref:DUF2064 domain-containing protein n=1 Tax=Fibrella aquatica TaxID=3242487 RepID=UPI0035207A89